MNLRTLGHSDLENYTDRPGSVGHPRRTRPRHQLDRHRGGLRPRQFRTVVGKAVKGLRTRPYIFTKCSLVWDNKGEISHNLQPASIHREAEASLRRLGVDTIDLYQIHWPARKGTQKVSKKHSQMKREALEKINRHANERRKGFGSVMAQLWAGRVIKVGRLIRKCFRIKRAVIVGA